MALVKKATLDKRTRGKSSSSVPVETAMMNGMPTGSTPRPSRARRKPADAFERLDQATEELASGLSESAAAAAQLQRSVEQMASGADEAASAAQESLGLIGHLRSHFSDASERAAASSSQMERLESTFAETSAEITASVAAIELNARRQLASVTIINQLETAAARVSAVGDTVVDLAEETAMLALNASIEATRAGEDGKGFAIVADEVRELAETSESSAIEMRALAAGIVADVRAVADRIRGASDLANGEAGNGRLISLTLNEGRAALTVVLNGAQEIAAAAVQAEAAASEAERGAEQVASAAEEQSAAAAEAQQAIEQQAISLEQSQRTAEGLAELSGALGAKQSGAAAIEQIAVSAEQLSATVQQLSGASSQIQIAIDQITRGAQLQSAATLQASTAMSQIVASAGVAADRAAVSVERLDALSATVRDSRERLAGLVAGVGSAVQETRAVLDLLDVLSQTVRRAEKITDMLALAALQTNMLGVSGAVEASRSSEAGDGFAPVTADIRKLARSQASNADEGKDVVRAIQDNIQAARRDLDLIVAAGETEGARDLPPPSGPIGLLVD